MKKGQKVKFNYEGKLESGQVFDSSKGKDPLEFTVGEKMIIPGLEKEIITMKKGDKKTIEVPPEEAYGERKKELLRPIPKSAFPDGTDLKKDMMVQLQGSMLPARIEEVKKDEVILDLNHPLAGKKLIFDVEVVDVA